jgi:indoleacetamide hydrolase
LAAAKQNRMSHAKDRLFNAASAKCEGNTMELEELSCENLATLIASRQIGAEEFARHLISTQNKTSDLNAFCALREDDILKSAREVDQRLARGERMGALDGVPISLKSNISCKGYTTTAGTLALRHFHAHENAKVVQKLINAGAIVFGNNNMHELAYGTTTNNAFSGATKNPFDHACVPGGSSGGCAAAVAARQVPASIGTDTGGSVRLPAALCGVWGYRPTTGRWPADGIVPISKTRDTPGPLARSGRDLALLDRVVSEQFELASPRPVKGLRIGVPTTYFWDAVEPEIAASCHAALMRLKSEGAELISVALGDLIAHNEQSTMAIALYEGKACLTRFLQDNGLGMCFEDVVDQVASADVRHTLASQLTAESAVSEEAYQQAINIHRPALMAQYGRIFADNKINVLAFPTCCIAAPKIGNDVSVVLNGEHHPIFPTMIHNTDVGSNAGLPGITVPVGLTSAGLPIGLAFDAPAGHDSALLSLACALDALFAAITLPCPIHS